MVDDLSEAFDGDFFSFWLVIVSGLAVLIGVFFFETVESMENVELVRAKLLVEPVTIEPFDFAFNLFFVSVNVLFSSEFDFDESVETFDVCLRLRGDSVEVRMISRPRDEIATVTFSDFCSPLPATLRDVDA